MGTGAFLKAESLIAEFTRRNGSADGYVKDKVNELLGHLEKAIKRRLEDYQFEEIVVIGDDVEVRRVLAEKVSEELAASLRGLGWRVSFFQYDPAKDHSVVSEAFGDACTGGDALIHIAAYGVSRRVCLILRII